MKIDGMSRTVAGSSQYVRVLSSAQFSRCKMNYAFSGLFVCSPYESNAGIQSCENTTKKAKFIRCEVVRILEESAEENQFGFNITCWVWLTEAMKQVSAVARHINDHIKQQDNFMRMLAIQRSLACTAGPRILIPGRVFVKEGQLRKVRVFTEMFFATS